MANRFALALTALAMMPFAASAGVRTQVDLRVHAAGVCWEPDVEFPVPCDDDDD